MQKYEILKDWNSYMPEPATVHNELKLRNIIIKPILYVKKSWGNDICTSGCKFVYTILCLTLQTRSDLFLPRNETALARSQFPHKCLASKARFSPDKIS